MIFKTLRLAAVILATLFGLAILVATFRSPPPHVCVCRPVCKCPDCGCNLFRRVLTPDNRPLADSDAIETISPPLTVAEHNEKALRLQSLGVHAPLVK